MRRRNRSRMQAVLYSPFTLIISAVLFAIIARAAWSIHEKARESQARLVVAQSELSRLKESESDLQARVDALSTPNGIKEEIRERYHAVEPGESVAVIIDSSTTAATAAALESLQADATSTGNSDQSWFSRMLHAIGF